MKKSPKGPPEKEIAAQIREFLRLNKILHWRQWQGQFSVPGIPDIVGIVPKAGTLLAIEIKTATGKVNEKQWEWIEAINREGGIAFIARSVQETQRCLQARGVKLRAVIP